MKLVDRGISRAKVDESERGIKEWEGRISLVTLLCPRDEKERECFLPVSSVFDTARNSWLAMGKEFWPLTNAVEKMRERRRTDYRSDACLTNYFLTMDDKFRHFRQV